MQKFSTHLLDSVMARKRTEREKFRREMMNRVFGLLGRLSKRMPFKEAYLFGSITKPYSFSKDSDIDLGISELRNEDFFRAMAFLSRQTGLEIDIVQLEGHRLADKIKRGGIPWKRKPSRS